jgi:hypothetical protein
MMSTKQALEASRLTEATIREEVDSLGDGIMDVVNLFEEDTGIEGVVFVSTRMASHGPRVKYLQKAGEDQKSFSVSISDYPEVLAASLPERVVNRMAPSVVAWVRLNKSDLLRLWNDGNRLSKRDLVELLDGLKRLPLR